MRRTGIRVQILGVLAAAWLLAAASPSLAQVPTESDVFVDRGILAYDEKQYPQALESFQQALRLSPDNINALYYAGLTYVALDQLPAAQEVLEQAHKLAPNDLDVTFQLAAVRFAREQYAEAEPLFRQVNAAQPKRPNLGYYLGFLEYRKQNYREALRFFRANVSSDPTFAQLTRFYASLSLSALGLAGQARSEIQESIRLQPLSELSGPAERFREVLGTAAKAERKFHVDAKLSLFYDDNVPVIPSKSGDAIAAIARETKHRSTGELGFVRFEYQPLRTPDWEGSVSYSLLQTINNDVSHFDLQNHTGNGNLAYKTNLWERPAVASFTYQYDYLRLDDRNFVSRHTVAPGLALVWDAMNLSQAQMRYQSKDFLHESGRLSFPDPHVDSRDADNYMGGFIHTLRFAADRHYVRFGYQFDYENAVGRNWDYFGNRVLAGGQVTLPWWDVRVRYDFDMHFRNYRHLNTDSPADSLNSRFRQDQDMNHLVSLSKDLPGNVTLSLEYLNNRSYSNLPIFDYTRNVVSLSASWRY